MTVFTSKCFFHLGDTLLKKICTVWWTMGGLWLAGVIASGGRCEVIFTCRGLQPQLCRCRCLIHDATPLCRCCIAPPSFLLPLMGACTLGTASCHSVIEASNQILTALFTAINAYALPSRLGRFYATFGSVPTGQDWRGVDVPSAPGKTLLAESYDPTSFYHLPFGSRAFITSALLISALSQFVNQVNCFFLSRDAHFHRPFPS